MIKCILILLFMTASLCSAQQADILFGVGESYLERHDIVYKTPGYEGYEGLPVGNGDLGGMIWNHKNGFEIQINKNDLYDKTNSEAGATLRGGARLSIDLGMPAFEWIYLDDFESRLSMRNANVSITSRTPFMETVVNSWVASDKNVWFFKLHTECQNVHKEGNSIRVGLERWGSRAFPGWYGGYTKDTSIGLGNTTSKINGSDIILEETFDGLQFSVACRILPGAAKAQTISSNRAELETDRKYSHDIILVVSVVTSNESETPTKSAIDLLDQAESQTYEDQSAKHQAWWNNFWNQSFVHLGDDYIENIYYLRRYLMASSSRGRYPVVFNGGLWTWNHDVRNWVTPHHWNTQQQYWGLASQNDCELMLPYLNTYFKLMPQAEKHAKIRGADRSILWSEPHDFFGSMTFWQRGDMINNFTPACQIAGFFWEYYQFTCDREFLEKSAYPFMKKAAEFYVQTLHWDDEKNEYYIYPSQPYESPRSNDLKNSITDRNVIASTMGACMEAAKILKKDTKKINEWRHIIDHLWPIPYREEPGIGEVMQLAFNPDGSIYPSAENYGSWTNHFSANTSLVFPSNLIGIDDKDSREFKAAANVVENHAPDKNAISPDPIVAARLGLGDVVLDRMTNSIRRLQHFPQGLFYNIDHWYNLSLYMDSVNQPDVTTQRDYIYDERAHYPKGHPAKPFIQCGMEPMSIIGAAVNEMLLQSNEGKIRVFPAVPKGWNPAFKLRARGAFIVSSAMEDDDSISGISIESLKGNRCKIVNPWEAGQVEIWNMDDKEKRIKFKIEESNVIVFKTQPGKSYIIKPKEKQFSKTSKIFEGAPNSSPKRFLEATLGKDRNF